MSSVSARYFTYLLVIIGLLILGNQKYLFSDDEERRIIDVLPKDPPQIPTLYSAEFTNWNSTYLHDDSLIIGVFYDGIAKAYPVMILDRHEVVNDYLGARALITPEKTASPSAYRRSRASL